MAAQGLAQPLLDRMTPVPGTLKIGVHIRIGDSGLSNALKRFDERYPLGCAHASYEYRSQQAQTRQKAAQVCQRPGLNLKLGVMASVQRFSKLHHTASHPSVPHRTARPLLHVRHGLRRQRRATICWVRAVEQQCRAVLPRRCSVFLASDSEEVRSPTVAICQ